MKMRTGVVIEVNDKDHTARVAVPELGGGASAEMKILKNSSYITIAAAVDHTHTAEMSMYLPNEGDMVLYAVVDEKSGMGFILGGV